MAVRKSKAGANLKRWFKEEWKDVRTGKACGRGKGEKRGTPYCRPSKDMQDPIARHSVTGHICDEVVNQRVGQQGNR